MRGTAVMLFALVPLLAACAGGDPVHAGGARCADVADHELLVDLAAAFPLADLQAEVSEIDFGTESARAHLLDGWAQAYFPDQTIAWGTGPVSSVQLFLSEPRRLFLTARVLPFRFPGAPPQRLDVRVNGAPAGRIDVPAGMNVVRAEIREALLRAGVNTLDFASAYHARPSDVVPGANDRRSLSVAWDVLSIGGAARSDAPSIRHDGGGGPILLLPPRSRIDYFESLPKGTVLTADRISLHEPTSSAPVELVVEIADAKSPQREQRIIAWPLEGDCRSIELPVSDDGPVRISLRAVAKDGSDRFGGIELVRPRLLRPPLDREVAEPAPRKRSERPPNILIYLIDTLRRDHLGVYGYEKPTSPEIDRFAAESTVFDSAFAQSSWTRPTVASIFTGLPPQLHRVNENESRLPKSAQTIAEVLAGAGYETAAFITNVNVSPTFGFDQGFETFEYLKEQEAHDPHQLSDRVNEAFSKWLDERDPSRPFFAYVHTSDPHDPYTPRSPFRERFGADRVDPELVATPRLHSMVRGNPVDEELRKQIIAAYDAEIAFNDASFGALVRDLRKRGLYEDTLVILLSDHGEEFFDHDWWLHGRTLYNEVVAIPLVIRFPDEAAGRRVADLAQQIDVFPTVLAAAGIDPASTPGRDLARPSHREERSDAREAYLSLETGDLRAAAVVAPPLKLIEFASEHIRPPELYDIEEDWVEERNQAKTRTVEAGVLRSHLHALRQPSPDHLDESVGTLDGEIRERLRQLGYLE